MLEGKLAKWSKKQAQTMMVRATRQTWWRTFQQQENRFVVSGLKVVRWWVLGRPFMGLLFFWFRQKLCHQAFGVSVDLWVQNEWIIFLFSFRLCLPPYWISFNAASPRSFALFSEERSSGVEDSPLRCHSSRFNLVTYGVSRRVTQQ